MAADGGWQVDQLQAALRQTAPRLAYLIPDFHNPTGALIDEAARREVLRVARPDRHRRSSSTSRSSTSASAPRRARRRPRSTLGHHHRLAVQAGLGRPAHRLGARVGRTGAAARRAARHHRHGRPGARPAGRGRAVRPSSTRSPPRGVAELRPAARRAGRRAGPRAAAVAGQRCPQGGLSLWAELDAPLSTPLSLLAAQAGVHRRARARGSASTARWSASCACRSRCRPTRSRRPCAGWPGVWPSSTGPALPAASSSSPDAARPRPGPR